jgi:fructokinase
MRIGIDLGGTKIEVLALHDDGRELLRRRVATPRDYDASLDAIAGLVQAVEAELGAVASVGVGIPGALSLASGLVKNANSTWLNGRALPVDLGTRLKRQVRVANDANCFVLSEAVDGAAAGARCVFGVIVGTGVGGGLVIDDGIWAGLNAIAGEWGHNPLPWPQRDEYPGPVCWCGKHGCLETFLSGPALERDHLAVAGVCQSAAAVAAAAAAGDPAAERTLARYEGRLARALATVVNLLDPDVVVLGGGLSNIERLYTNIPQLWSQWAFSDRLDTRLVPPLHGDSSGVRGAAWLWGGPERKATGAGARPRSPG